MARSLALLAAAALATAIGASYASPVSADQCAAITNRAPCGQNWDTQERCEYRGCCFDGSDKVNPCFYPGGNAVPIKYVHMVQASHFDAGFAYTIRDVLQLWWYTHFPRAVSLGLAMEANASLPAGVGLHFTAQCWLIDLMLNCPPDVPGLPCPTAGQLANLTLAIQKGWLTWHAFPFNSEAEMHSPELLAAGFDRCHALDDRFGFPRKATMSQRDVPGTTRASIPDLLKANVTTMSIGSNGASTPPFVPRAYVWKDPVSQQSLLSLAHGFGYGGISYEDAVIIPGSEHALVFAWRGDNQGPPNSVAEIVGNIASVQAEFPGAAVFASTFDNFTQHVVGNASLLAQLPALTAEIGSTWVHGEASEPFRTAFFKRAGRLRTACLAAGQCSYSDPVFANHTRLLLKCGEHTWGKDIKTFLHDQTNWSNAQLRAQLAANASNFFDVVNSWTEQRAWCVDYAIQALTAFGHPLGPQLQAAYDDLRPASPQPPSPAAAGYAPFQPGTPYNAGRWQIAFDGVTGAISTLVDTASGTTWASPADGSKLAWAHYVTLSQADYANFTGPEPAGYYPGPGANSPSWFQLDFGKPNVSSANPVHQEVAQSLSSLWLKQTADTASFLVEATFQPATLNTYYGAPASMWLQLDVPRFGGPGSASINASWTILNKTATRLPEGLFLRFNASAAGSSGGALQWRIGKLNSFVDPFDVVPGGAQRNHGYWGGFAAVKATPGGGAGATLAIESDDFALVNAGRPWPLPAPTLVGPDASEGLSFLALDNTWGTNYPMWLPWAAGDECQTWRFSITADGAV